MEFVSRSKTPSVKSVSIMNTDSIVLRKKLYEILNEKIHEMDENIVFGTEGSRMSRLNAAWNERLESIPGLKRMSMMMSLIVERKNDEVWIDDPLVSIGSSQGKISVPLDVATKIVTLGYLP